MAFGVTSSRFFGRGDESLFAGAPSRQDDAFMMSGMPRLTTGGEKPRTKHKIVLDWWRGLVRERNRRSSKGQAFWAPAVLALHVQELSYCLLGLPAFGPCVLCSALQGWPARPCHAGLLGACCLAVLYRGPGSSYFLARVLAGQNSHCMRGGR